MKTNGKLNIKRILSIFYKKRSSKSNEPEQPENPEQFELQEPEVEEEPREISYHLSNHNNDDIDRQHFNHFFRKHVFQNNFSAPMKEKLIQGGCKVLDVG